MMNRRKEIAKFVCGVEAFHALIHAYFWYSGTTLKVGPLRETPAVHRAGAIGNAAISLLLGIYAWRRDDSESPVVSTSR
ncbi:MAG TPA: hypothetical protein VJS44_01810 [Pyrinomonadaceae bacterium]|nr:hypothetical protein [Pyrinomonadaceae bacterium]